ncbi:MAG TPA: spermidine synthase, partial [Kribbella sp.]|nr:spermidine synthase [Kribbella sp.]
MAVDSATDRVPTTSWPSPFGVRTRLVASSALMLFVELALIRWTGSNVVHLSYFSNFVLLGSFLGIGIGVLRSSRAKRLPYYSPIMLGLLVLVIAWKPVTVNRGGSSVIYFTSLNTTGPPVWVILPIIFVAVAVVLAGPAELVGRCFANLPRLTAYRFDLVGSLIGIITFTALSFLGAPPIWWGLIVAVVFGVLMIPRTATAPGKRVVATALSAALVLTPLIVMLGVLFHESTKADNSWSPYYKVQTKQYTFEGVPLLTITVNGVPHQQAIPADARLQWEPQYGLPYERATTGKTPKNVLIIGAGSGSDVAIALKKGATHVDAVEIDPRIRDLGKQLHPDHPYQDPRVTSHIDDGRAFLSRTKTKYDMILLALPDSLTLVNGASSLRLESYLFTKQAFESARDHLNPGGAFAMYNYYRETWLIDRLASTA